MAMWRTNFNGNAEMWRTKSSCKVGNPAIGHCDNGLLDDKGNLCEHQKVVLKPFQNGGCAKLCLGMWDSDLLVAPDMRWKRDSRTVFQPFLVPDHTESTC